MYHANMSLHLIFIWPLICYSEIFLLIIMKLCLFPFVYLHSDIDECSIGSHNCDINAECSNTNGSFLCVCKTGYTGNGTTCTGILIF